MWQCDCFPQWPLEELPPKKKKSKKADKQSRKRCKKHFPQKQRTYKELTNFFNVLAGWATLSQWEGGHLGLLAMHSICPCASSITPLLFSLVPLPPHKSPPNTLSAPCAPSPWCWVSCGLHLLSVWWRSLHNRDFRPITRLSGNPRCHIGFQQDVWRGAALGGRCREAAGRQRRCFQDMSARSQRQHAGTNIGPLSKTHPKASAFIKEVTPTLWLTD